MYEYKQRYFNYITYCYFHSIEISSSNMKLFQRFFNNIEISKENIEYCFSIFPNSNLLEQVNEDEIFNKSLLILENVSYIQNIHLSRKQFNRIKNGTTKCPRKKEDFFKSCDYLNDEDKEILNYYFTFNKYKSLIKDN